MTRNSSNLAGHAVADGASLSAAAVLAAALVKAGRELGLTQTELGVIVGRDRTALSRGALLRWWC